MLNKHINKLFLRNASKQILTYKINMTHKCSEKLFVVVFLANFRLIEC